jgi:mannosyltransferase
LTRGLHFPLVDGRQEKSLIVSIDRHRRASLVAALLLTLVAFGLRVYRLDGQSLWVDEVVSYYRALYLVSPPANLAPLVQEPRHLVYAVVMKPWVMLIPNEFGLRWPSVLAGTLAVAMMYQVGARLGSRRVGLLAAIFLALSPTHLYYAQEARQYALVLLLGLTSLWVLTLLESRVSWARWAYPLSVALTGAVHAVAGLWLAVQSGVLLARKLLTGRGPGWGTWLAAQVGLLSVLGVIYTLDDRGGTTWIDRPGPDDFGALFLSAVGLRLEYKDVASIPWTGLAQAALLGLLAIGLLRLVQQSSTRARLGGQWVALLVGLLVILPPLAAYGLSFWWRPLWVPRYLILSQASVLLLLGLSAGVPRSRRLGGALAAVVLTSSLIGSVRYLFDPLYQRHDWRGAATYVVEHTQPGDVLLLDRPMHMLNIQFYLTDAPLETHFLYGGGALSADIIRERMRPYLVEHERVWVVWRKDRWDGFGDWLPFPEPDATRLDYVDFGRLELYLYRCDGP